MDNITNADGSSMSPRTNLDGSSRSLVSKSETRTGRGFAGMSRERQREVASQGGRAAHASGNARQFTSEEARAAAQRRHELRRQADAEAQAQHKAMKGPGA